LIDSVPVISVITVVYNARDALEKTINSVKKQDYSRLEYVVIDGGSKDGSVELLEQNMDSIHYWVSERDSGIYDAMNKGVVKTNGELVLFLNAGDEFFSNDVLSKFVDEYFDETKKCNLYLFSVITNRGKIKKPKFVWLKQHYMLPASHQGMLYPSWVFDHHLFSTKYNISSDFHHFAQIRKKLSLVSVGIILSIYDTSGVSSVNFIERDKEYSRIYEELSIRNFFRMLKRCHELLDFVLKKR
jgi:putative colanic acid biosynthesis glycosyltransferase